MTTWKDGGMCGNHLHEVTNEAGNQSICYVRTRCNKHTEDNDHRKWTIVPWPEGMANFRLILQAPLMLEALEAIVDLSNWMEEKEIVCNSMEEIARAAVAAVKGENDGLGD